jgi:hypothetical protein
MSEKKKIKATSTLAKLYEEQGLIADAIAAYETIYANTPTEELFNKLEDLRHQFIHSEKTQIYNEKSMVSGIFTAHEKEYFRILTHHQFVRYKDAFNPDTSELEITIEMEEDDENFEVIEVQKDDSLSLQNIEQPEKVDPVFQEVLDNIHRTDSATKEMKAIDAYPLNDQEDYLKQNLVVRDIITHLKRVYGEDTPLKSIDGKELLNSIAGLLI